MHDLIKWSRAHRIWSNYEDETHITQLYFPKRVLSSKIHKLVLCVHSAAVIMLPEVFVSSYQIRVLSAGLFCCFLAHVCNLNISSLWHTWKTPGNVHSSFASGNSRFTDHQYVRVMPMWADFTGLSYFYPFSPLLLPFHILFIEISLPLFIHLCSSAMHKKMASWISIKARKLSNAQMQMRGITVQFWKTGAWTPKTGGQKNVKRFTA